MLTEMFQNIAYNNYYFSSIPHVTQSLVNDAARLLMTNLGAQLVPSGSFNSKTCVQGYSDIDILAVLDAGSREANQKYFRDFILSVDGMLRHELCALDIDIYFSPPAVCLSHLSAPEYQIEITPAEQASSFGIFLGNPAQSDYLILDEDFVNVIATNPTTQKETAEYLNHMTENKFSHICSLLKLWKYKNQVPVTSFAIEVFVYHWLRGTCGKGGFPVMESLNGVTNLTFQCRKTSSRLEINVLNVLEKLQEQLLTAQGNREVYTSVNPFVRMKIPNEMFQMFTSMEKQEEGLKKIETSIAILRKAIQADEENKHSKSLELARDFLKYEDE